MRTEQQYQEARKSFLEQGNDFWAIKDNESGLDDGSSCSYSVGNKYFSSRREAVEFLFDEAGL